MTPPGCGPISAKRHVSQSWGGDEPPRRYGVTREAIDRPRLRGRGRKGVSPPLGSGDRERLRYCVTSTLRARRGGDFIGRKYRHRAGTRQFSPLGVCHHSCVVRSHGLDTARPIVIAVQGQFNPDVPFVAVVPILDKARFEAMFGKSFERRKLVNDPVHAPDDTCPRDAKQQLCISLPSSDLALLYNDRALPPAQTHLG